MPANETRQWRLNDILVEILGSENVYYEQQEDVKLKYHCIVYKLATPSTMKANNHLYFYMDCYELTVITEDPYNTIAKQILEKFTYASSKGRYIGDGLYHDSITLYF